MLRQIRLDKYPKKSLSFRPEILSEIILIQRRPFDTNTHKFITTDIKNLVTYQLYVARKLNKQIGDNVQFIQHTPNLIILQHEPYSLIFEEQCQLTLKQYMAFRQAEKGLPYLSQIQAKQIILEVLSSLESFNTHNIQYNCLFDNNIVRLRGKWMLSLASALSNSYLLDKTFFDSRRKGQEGVFYAIGSLMFKMLFGFVPFQQNVKKPSQFKFSAYFQHLEQQSNKKLIKIYYYADRIQSISGQCQQMIEDCLSGRISSIEQFRSHQGFKWGVQSPQKEAIQNREIKMLNYFDNKYHSLIMASIDRRRKNAYERVHQKMQSDISGFLQLKQVYSKQPLFNYLKFKVEDQGNKQGQQQKQKCLAIGCKYFGRQIDSEQTQRPTLELIKLIDQDRNKYPDLHLSQDRQSRIKLYAFPYVVVFELANVYSEQTPQIKNKIQQLLPLLLEVSSMHDQITDARLEKLHLIKNKFKDFQDIKLKYRQLINFIYRHFLNEAMRRYNAKKQNLSISQKIRLKQEGLGYYRLCLKLIQVSLIVRKGGKDLDLQRIQTSLRKQIQHDLETILKAYFPNRVQIR